MGLNINYDYKDLQDLSGSVVAVGFSLIFFLFETETVNQCNYNKVSNLFMHFSDFLRILFYEID